MNQNSDTTLSRNVLEMATVAIEYCSFLEESDKTESKELLNSLQGLLPLLYLRGNLLPIIEPEYPEFDERYVTEEQWNDIYGLLKTKLGNIDLFWFAESPTIEETDTIRGSIAEKLADIYQDMKDFVMLYKNQQLSKRQNAIASCKNNFENEWGAKIATLIPIIHELQQTPIAINDDTLFE